MSDNPHFFAFQGSSQPPTTAAHAQNGAGPSERGQATSAPSPMNEEVNPAETSNASTPSGQQISEAHPHSHFDNVNHQKARYLDGLPPRSYLDSTVVPVVLEGMRRLVVERPPDPLTFLGQFILDRARQDHQKSNSNATHLTQSASRPNEPSQDKEHKEVGPEDQTAQSSRNQERQTYPDQASISPFVKSEPY